MYMAIAAESSGHPARKSNYRVWYLEINKRGDVIGVGVKSKEELVESIFANYAETGDSCWRAFRRNFDHSTAIEIFDFISQNDHENTHFGELPTLSEFQGTLDALKMNFEFKAIA